MTRSRRIAARLALVLAGLFMGAGAGEILLRIFLPQTLGLRWYTREGIMVNVPNLRTTYVRPEYTTTIAIDSDGLRDREYPPGKPDGVYRILLLGDSYAEALQVESEISFPKRVEGLIGAAKAGVRIEVVNAGVAGYGTADELRYLEAYGARWAPDLVLLAFYCGNDIGNNLSESGLRRDAGKLQVARKPLTAWQYYVKGVRNWVAARSHLWQFFRARTTFGGGENDGAQRPSGAPPAAKAATNPSTTGQATTEPTATEPSAAEPATTGRGTTSAASTAGNSDISGRAVRPWSERPFEEYDDRDAMKAEPGPEFVRGWKLTQELIARVDETARALGAKTAIVAIPSRWQVDSVFLVSRLGSGAIADGIYDPARPGRLVCEFAGTRGVPCLDLAPRFRAAGADATWYWKIDSHFTPKAHEAAARALASFLIEEVRVPERGAAGASGAR